ncbi:MAG: GNAT family N-acetyltransferase [Rhodanobacteraceae bacterium]
MTADRAGSPLLKDSPFETARFDLRISRGTPTLADAPALIDELRRERVDVAILRVREGARELAQEISSAGMPAIVADALVHYAVDLPAPESANPAGPRVRLRRADARDAANLVAMVRRIFSGYPTHYHANPLFDPERILDGYAEWAVRHAERNDDGRLAWIVEVDGEAVGFSCVEIAHDDSTARGVLNGILPDWRGRGIYRAMLRAMLARFSDEGVKRFVISTQVHNTAVQRVWISEGFTLERNENTVHVNALQGAG